ncbi:hypothetical protein [Ilumatobacter sp.]|uniref:hypothetical protein n=1 Tax=Ilumatobacter sp. TaxID=1967498 RepID=UPI003AF77E78
MGTLTDPIAGAQHTEVGGLIVDEVAAGAGRVKRVIYPPGWRWSDAMSEITGTETCRHVHVGFMVQGTMVVRFDDGCEVTFSTPSAVVIEPGHDGWVVGDDAVVLIQVDAGSDTSERLGLTALRHTCTG